MSRPNQPRTIGAEDRIARLMRDARASRGWSCAAMAEAMTNQGCHIDPSAIYKIEGQPRRRITVDELVAFARIVGSTVDELLGEDYEQPTMVGDMTIDQLRALLTDAPIATI